MLGNEAGASDSSQSAPAQQDEQNDKQVKFKIMRVQMMQMVQQNQLEICNAMGEMARTCFGFDSDAARSITCFASDCTDFQPPPPDVLVGGLAGASVAPKNTVTILIVTRRVSMVQI